MSATETQAIVSDSSKADPHLASMRAARLHEVGGELHIERVDRPRVRPTDVVVQIKACGIVHNLKNTLNLGKLVPKLVQPPFPAIYGLDAAGVVVEKGDQVHGIEIGERVYVNPLRYCGGCRPCRAGKVMACEYLALNGYLGYWPKSKAMFEDYPGGGLAEYMLAPQYSLVSLPENVSFETAARWGYLGTGYAALQLGKADMTTSVFINGISGTLGLGTALFALALGAPRVFGVGRNRELLERVKAIAPDRIHVLALDGSENIGEWVRSLNKGVGADVVIDALPPRSPEQAYKDGFAALAMGGRHVNVGGYLGEVPINPLDMTSFSHTYIGSCWFTTAQGQEMADLAESGTVNLDMFEHERFALEDINVALELIAGRTGGFSNYVIMPELAPRS